MLTSGSTAVVLTDGIRGVGMRAPRFTCDVLASAMSALNLKGDQIMEFSLGFRSSPAAPPNQLPCCEPDASHRDAGKGAHYVRMGMLGIQLP